MIIGIGVDIEEINRFDEPLAKKILSPQEYNVYLEKNVKKKEYLASRFSAKEALVKAFRKPLSFSSISILNDLSGAPYVLMDTTYIIHISISHTDNLVISYVILETI